MSDGERFDALLTEQIDEARRGDVDAEAAAAILRNHAETLETEGFTAYTPASGLPEENR